MVSCRRSASRRVVLEHVSEHVGRFNGRASSGTRILRLTDGGRRKVAEMFYTSAHVQECKDRKNRWRGVLKYKDPMTGEWRERKRTFSGVSSRSEAIVELGRWRSAMEEAASSNRPLMASNVTVHQAVAELLEFQLSLHRISIVTFQNMMRVNKTIVRPWFGSQAFSEVTRDDVQSFVSELSATYAPASVRMYFAVVSKAYKDAVRRGVIDRDPTVNILLPKLQAQQINYLDASGRRTFFEKMSEESAFFLPTMIAYYTGMRAGEICALKWNNIGFDTRTLAVRRTAVFREGPGGGNVEITVPKTPKARRAIPMADQLYEILRLTLAGRRGVSADDFVVDQHNPKLLCSGFLRWSKRNEVVGSIGRPISMHGLRHTFATLGVQAGMDVKSLSSILGHASALVTLDTYASDDENAKRVAIDTFSEFLRSESPGWR